MQTISVKEARGDFSHLLDEVEHGQTILITRHGKPVAQLSKPKAKASTSRKPRPDFAALRAKIHVQGKPMSEEIAAMRDQGRF